MDVKNVQFYFLNYCPAAEKWNKKNGELSDERGVNSKPMLRAFEYLFLFTL